MRLLIHRWSRLEQGFIRLLRAHVLKKCHSNLDHADASKTFIPDNFKFECRNNATDRYIINLNDTKVAQMWKKYATKLFKQVELLKECKVK